MGSLEGKKIILSITGSIAAYKSASLTRLLIKAGAEVQVIMTPSATSFITPLTLGTLSKHPVHTSVSDGDSWDNHVELGLWADVMLIAPCTATTLGKMANGIADTMVVATYLSAKCPIHIAPAMDLDMWIHPSTKNNLEKLTSFGNHIIPVGHGELASGLHGDGRMAEPEDIVSHLRNHFSKKEILKGRKIMITAGPTYEAIDPVRFIGNRSTGKMGIALARACADLGAEVDLILGPTAQIINHKSVTVHKVTSALQMFEESVRLFPTMDAGIMAAAVADFTPKSVADQKIKKGDDDLSINLQRTKDIAANLGKSKRADQMLIGFALETNNEEANASRKLQKKNFDFIVLNSLNDKGAGFGHDTNKVRIIAKDGHDQVFNLKSKTDVAYDIIDEAIRLGL
ncbi:UNVERIFIED_CONTAM: hypothetical protein GTU68_062144 [Idotea baltica]|nr:hypothetical protein [Idotea baltica]